MPSIYPWSPSVYKNQNFQPKQKHEKKKTSQYNEKPIEETFNENEYFPAVQFLKDSKWK